MDPTEIPPKRPKPRVDASPAKERVDNGLANPFDLRHLLGPHLFATPMHHNMGPLPAKSASASALPSQQPPLSKKKSSNAINMLAEARRLRESLSKSLTLDKPTPTGQEGSSVETNMEKRSVKEGFGANMENRHGQENLEVNMEDGRRKGLGANTVHGPTEDLEVTMKGRPTEVLDHHVESAHVHGTDVTPEPNQRNVNDAPEELPINLDLEIDTFPGLEDEVPIDPLLLASDAQRNLEKAIKGIEERQEQTSNPGHTQRNDDQIIPDNFMPSSVQVQQTLSSLPRNRDVPNFEPEPLSGLSAEPRIEVTDTFKQDCHETDLLDLDIPVANLSDHDSPELNPCDLNLLDLDIHVSSLSEPDSPPPNLPDRLSTRTSPLETSLPTTNQPVVDLVGLRSTEPKIARTSLPETIHSEGYSFDSSLPEPDPFESDLSSSGLSTPPSSTTPSIRSLSPPAILQWKEAEPGERSPVRAAKVIKSNGHGLFIPGTQPLYPPPKSGIEISNKKRQIYHSTSASRESPQQNIKTPSSTVSGKSLRRPSPRVLMSISKTVLKAKSPQTELLAGSSKLSSKVQKSRKASRLSLVSMLGNESEDELSSFSPKKPSRRLRKDEHLEGPDSSNSQCGDEGCDCGRGFCLQCASSNETSAC